MFRLTKKIEYGLIAIKHMAAKPAQAVTTAKEIANQYQIPRELLAKILQQLTREHIVRSVQGPQGGYVLAKPLSEIALEKFFRVLEGNSSFIECAEDDVSPCARLENCIIRLPLLQIDAHLRHYFSTISLQDIMNGRVPSMQEL